MEFRPCIDIHNGKVKQIIGSTLNDDENPVENFVSVKPPAFYAELFKSDNLKGGHVIMLGKGNEQAALCTLREYPGGLQIGGGINADNALFYLNNGASHVIVTSYIFSDGLLDYQKLQNIVKIIGRERLVIDLSCRKKNAEYYVVTDRWQKYTDFKLNKDNLFYIQKYCAELLIHGVDVEGKCLGIDDELVDILSNYAEIPVTYAGGISSLIDLEKISCTGNKKINATIGSALDIFGGKLKYKEVLDWFKKNIC